MKVLIILIFLSSSANAQKSLSPQAYQANVRPVLSGIINDFYQMVTLFPEFPAGIVTILESIHDLETEKAAIRSNCPQNLTAKCLGDIDQIKRKLSTILSQSLELSGKQSFSSSLFLNNLAGARIYSDFYLATEEMKGKLENASLKIKAQVSFRELTYPIIKELDQLSSLISLSLIEYIPYAYRDEFNHFYFNFIHTTHQNINRRNNHEFLNRNLNSLNFAINLFVQNLTKRNKKTPEGMAPYLSAMHNRWNSILRYYY